MAGMEDLQRRAELAEAVRAACMRAALEGYERALTDGLCAEGALEVALESIRSLDIREVLQQFDGGRHVAPARG